LIFRVESDSFSAFEIHEVNERPWSVAVFTSTGINISDNPVNQDLALRVQRSEIDWIGSLTLSEAAQVGTVMPRFRIYRAYRTPKGFCGLLRDLGLFNLAP
jgi:hypothetical protein